MLYKKKIFFYIINTLNTKLLNQKFISYKQYNLYNKNN